MKGRRLIVLGICVSLIAVVLTGCGVISNIISSFGTDEGSELNAAILAASEAESIEAEGTFDLEVSMNYGGEEVAGLETNMGMKLTGTVHASSFTEPMKTKVNLKVDLSGIQGLLGTQETDEISTMEVDTYMMEQDGNYVNYMKTNYAGDNQWIKQIIGNADEMKEAQSEVNQLDAKLFMDDKYTYEEQPDAEENGKSYKVYICKVPKESILEILKGINGVSSPLAGYDSGMVDAVSEYLTDIEYTIWIDKDEKQLYRVTMPLANMLNNILQKVMEEQKEQTNELMQLMGSVKVEKFDFDIRYTNYNKVEDFELPKEAMSAEEIK
ncbi:MAG: hypothetical protein LBR68_02665 [Lachnoclostridium sp.]|jgi:hypothetical protein|nr:hypothetical protein [Lachnoclostridium sp.]